MKVFGRLLRAQLEKLGSALTAGIEGRIALYNAEVQVDVDGSNVKTLVDKDSTQTLTGKTLVAASNTITTAANGNLSSIELNAALAELQTDIDTRATSSALTAHASTASGVHGVTGNIVGTSDSQTLTNKTLTAPVISTISNTGTLTLPTSTDTLVGRATTDALTNKTIVAANNTITTAANGNLAATELNAALAELQTDIDGRVAKSTLTTKGDIFVRKADGTITRLGVGSDGSTLIADSASDTGLNWGAGGGGGLGSLQVYGKEGYGATESSDILGVKQFSFEKNSEQHVIASFRVSAGYFAGSQLNLKGRFKSSTGSGNAVFVASMSIIRGTHSETVDFSSGAIALTTTDSEFDFAATTSDGRLNDYFLTEGDIIVIDLWRNSTNGSDTLSGDAILVGGIVEVSAP